MKKVSFFILTVFCLIWLQILNHHFLGKMGLAPNLALIASLYFGLIWGPLAGELTGFAWGLLSDGSTLSLIGTHALLFAAAGYFAGMISRQWDGNKAWAQAIFAALITLLYLALFSGLEKLFSHTQHPVPWQWMVQPLINAVVAPVVFELLNQWSLWWELLPERR